MFLSLVYRVFERSVCARFWFQSFSSFQKYDRMVLILNQLSDIPNMDV